jgi:hypothetical protein
MNARRVAVNILPAAFIASLGSMLGTFGTLCWWLIFAQQDWIDFAVRHGQLPLYTSVGFIAGGLIGGAAGGIWQAVHVHSVVVPRQELRAAT